MLGLKPTDIYFLYRNVVTAKVAFTTAADDIKDPVVQSIVSLTSSLVVKMLIVIVSTISNSQVFFAVKM